MESEQVGNTEIQNESSIAELHNILVVTPDADKLLIRSVSNTEPIIFVKQTLAEYVETCHITAYSLLLDGIDSGEPVCLTDFTEADTLTQLIPSGETYPTIRMKLDLYDIKKARAHVKRLNELITNPPTARGSQLLRRESDNADDSVRVLSDEDVLASLPTMEDMLSDALLGSFYKETLFRVSTFAPGDAPTGASTKSPSQCILSATLSAWNPPPPHRRLQV